MSWGHFGGRREGAQENVQKMSRKYPGAEAGAGTMSRKCQKHVPQMSVDIIRTY